MATTVERHEGRSKGGDSSSGNGVVLVTVISFGHDNLPFELLVADELLSDVERGRPVVSHLSGRRVLLTRPAFSRRRDQER